MMTSSRKLPERAVPAPRFSAMVQAVQADLPRANVNDRRSIERLYPPDAFARDAAENDRPGIAILRGVRIAAAPDADGNFPLEPAARHAGEMPAAPFLAPFRRRAASENAGADPDPRRLYDAFLDDIIAAARRYGYRAEASPGPGDPRLCGPRQ
jgi:hypothetical protein